MTWGDTMGFGPASGADDHLRLGGRGLHTRRGVGAAAVLPHHARQVDRGIPFDGDLGRSFLELGRSHVLSRDDSPGGSRLVPRRSADLCNGGDDILVPLQTAVHNGWHKRSTQPVFSFTGDVEGAFDHMGHELVVKSMLAQWFHPRLIRVIVY